MHSEKGRYPAGAAGSLRRDTEMDSEHCGTDQPPPRKTIVPSRPRASRAGRPRAPTACQCHRVCACAAWIEQ
jgi:hypothetical protein